MKEVSTGRKFLVTRQVNAIGRLAGMVGLTLLAACSGPGVLEVVPGPKAEGLSQEAIVLAQASVPDGFALKEARLLDAEELQLLPDDFEAAGSFVLTVASTGAKAPGTINEFLATVDGLQPQVSTRFDPVAFKAATYRALYGQRNTVSNMRNPADHTAWMGTLRVSLHAYDYTGEVKFFCNLFKTYCRMTSGWVKWAMTDRKSMVTAVWNGDLNTPAIHLEVLQYDKAGFGQAKVMFGHNDAVFIYNNAGYYQLHGLPLPRISGKYLKGLSKFQKQANLSRIFASGTLTTQAGLDTLGICISPKPGQKIPDPGNIACPMNPGDVDVQGCPNCSDEINRYNKVNDALFIIENETIPNLDTDGGVAAAAGLSCVATIAGVVTVVSAPFTCTAFAVTLTNVTAKAVSAGIQQNKYKRQLDPVRNTMNHCIQRQNQCKQPPIPGTAPIHEIISNDDQG